MTGTFTVTTNGVIGAVWLGVSALRTLRWADLRWLKPRRKTKPHIRLAIGNPPPPPSDRRTP